MSGLVRGTDRGLLVLVSLAGGEKHGYALLKDIEDFAHVRLSPGTLYAAIARLESGGLVEPVGPPARRRPYRLTRRARQVLAEELEAAEAVSHLGMSRLRGAAG